jgi:hypothetical protein
MDSGDLAVPEPTRRSPIRGASGDTLTELWDAHGTMGTEPVIHDHEGK